MPCRLPSSIHRSATLNSLLTATVATGPLGTLQTTLAAYQGSTATWAQLCTAANAAAPLLATLGGAVQMGAAAITTPVTGIAASYSATAGGGYTPPVIAVASAQSFVTAASNTLASSMPNFGPIKASVDAVAVSFAALGSPPSTVSARVDAPCNAACMPTAHARLLLTWHARARSTRQIVAGPRAQLQAINATAVATGDSVKQQISGQVATFRNATDRVKSMSVGRLEGAQARYEAPVQQYDGYRYIGGMVLYAVSILFVALLLLASLANYHFGANISTLGLLLVTLLYFLLALLIALLVGLLHLGCGDLEPLMVRLAPATFKPLLRCALLGTTACCMRARMLQAQQHYEDPVARMHVNAVQQRDATNAHATRAGRRCRVAAGTTFSARARAWLRCSRTPTWWTLTR